MKLERKSAHFALALALMGASIAHANENDPLSILREKGLRLERNKLVLIEKLNIAKDIRSLNDLQKELADAIGNEEALEEQIAVNDYQRVLLEVELRDLNARLQRASTVRRNNRLVGRINEIHATLNLMNQTGEGSNIASRVREAVGDARRRFREKIADINAQISDHNSKGENLLADPVVKEAITKLQSESDREINLGLSARLERQIKQLEKYESAIETNEIQLDGQGGVFFIDVDFGRGKTERLIFDTGASYVSLPADMARRIGIRTRGGRPVGLQIADGSVVEAVLTKIPKMSVGEFKVEDVPCVVAPASSKNAPALLGGSFLRHFNYNIDPSTGTLTLTRVETSNRQRGR